MNLPLGSRAVFRLLATSVIAACQSVASVAGPVAFGFQGGTVSSPIVVSVRNTGDQVVFLPRCGEHMLPEIERRSEGQWVNAAEAICPAGPRMDPIRLAVGAVYRDSIGVRQAGTYRLRLPIWRRNGSRIAPSETVVSQSFAVE